MLAGGHGNFFIFYFFTCVCIDENTHLLRDNNIINNDDELMSCTQVKGNNTAKTGNTCPFRGLVEQGRFN